ncbi:MAG: T9SS type A sorting domain-containing protein, partial [Saprospiraceae bacterium]|nr:T9SS type A sorting domain-containing protein [Saprospiraceae bacterium]
VSSLELRLVDQLGRTIYHSTQAAEAGIINIPVSNLGSGVYFLQVNADGVMETHKLVR